ncbi:MAG: glutamate--tRNA ligase, partial [Aestuariivirga sp.]
KQWHEIISGNQAGLILADDKDFISKAHDVLPAEPWDQTTWKAWTEAVKAASGRKGKDLFMPLRRALTGLDHGPELAALLPLIGRDRALARLA